MPQLDFDFTPRAVENVERLKGQSHRLYQYLLTGKTIHVFHPMKMELQIGYLNSRISDLVEAGVQIHKRTIKVKDINAEEVSVKEYSLSPFK